MRRLAEIYAAFLRTALALEVSYRASSVIWLLGQIVEPVVYLSVWSAAARAQGGSLLALTPADFAAYYLVLAFVNQITFDWHMWEFQYRIAQGQFAFHLLRPVHPLHGDLAENLAHKLMMQPFLLPALALLWWIFGATAHLDLKALALFPLALGLAFLLRFTLEWTLALSCFWTTRILAVNNAYTAVFFFLSGRVAPNSIMPEGLREAALALPFYWMVGFPVELALGRLDAAETARGFSLQLIWLAVCALALRWLWPLAARRFSSVGG